MHTQYIMCNCAHFRLKYYFNGHLLPVYFSLIYWRILKSLIKIGQKTVKHFKCDFVIYYLWIVVLWSVLPLPRQNGSVECLLGPKMGNVSGLHVACLHDQSKSGFFGRPAFFQPIRAFRKLFRLLWLAGSEPAFQKATFVLTM